jgi:hypothetical protein
VGLKTKVLYALVACVVILAWLAVRPQREPPASNRDDSCPGVKPGKTDLQLGLGRLWYCVGPEHSVVFHWDRGPNSRGIVSIPPDSRWRRDAPMWARDRRGEIVAEAKRIATVNNWELDWVESGT